MRFLISNIRLTIMPKRLTPDTWIQDESFNSLSLPAEVFFRRLWTLADDYGNFHGEPAALRARVFPMYAADMNLDAITAYVDMCVEAGLLTKYTHGSAQYVHILNFGQQIKSRPKFPMPPLPEAEARQLTPDPQRPTLHNVTVLLARSAVGLTPPQVQDCAARYLQTDIPEEWQADCLSFATHYAAKRNRPIV